MQVEVNWGTEILQYAQMRASRSFIGDNKMFDLLNGLTGYQVAGMTMEAIFVFIVAFLLGDWFGVNAQQLKEIKEKQMASRSENKLAAQHRNMIGRFRNFFEAMSTKEVMVWVKEIGGSTLSVFAERRGRFSQRNTTFVLSVRVDLNASRGVYVILPDWRNETGAGMDVRTEDGMQELLDRLKGLVQRRISEQVLS